MSRSQQILTSGADCLEELQGKATQENFKLSDASGASCHGNDERSTVFCYLFDNFRFA